MVKKEEKRVLVVQENTAEMFQAALNEALKEGNCDITFKQGGNGHCAYVVITNEVIEYTSAKDKYESTGRKLLCVECPYVAEPEEGKRYFRCTKHKRHMVRPGDVACEKLYDDVDAGIVDI